MARSRKGMIDQAKGGISFKRWLNRISAGLSAIQGIWHAFGIYSLSIALPAVLGLILAPRIYDGLGPAQFGLLTVAWFFLTFTSNFDLGVGRALVRLLARDPGAPLNEDHGSIVAVALTFQFILGVLGVLIVLMLVMGLGYGREWIDDNGDGWGFAIGVSLLPVLTLSNGLRSILEAKLKFGVVGTTGLLNGCGQFAIPFILQAIGWGVIPIVAAIMIIRAGVVCILLTRVLMLLDRVCSLRPSFTAVRRLWDAANWIVVQSILTPFFVAGDKLALPIFLPLAKISFYTLPFDFLIRLLIIPSILNRITFPYMNQATEGGVGRQEELYIPMRRLMGAYGVLFIVGTFLVGPVLEQWMGADFSRESTPITRVVLLAISFAGFTYLSINILLSKDRIGTIAKWNLLLMGPYLIAMWIVLSWGSLFGAVLVWSARLIAESIFAQIVAAWLVGRSYVRECVITAAIHVTVVLLLI